MHIFTFGGLTLSSADYIQVGRFCSSRQGGEWLVRIVRRGKYVPCWLGPPCKVKSDQFCKDRWTKRGVNWAFFKFLKQVKATLTYAILVRLNSPNRLAKQTTQAYKDTTR